MHDFLRKELLLRITIILLFYCNKYHQLIYICSIYLINVVEGSFVSNKKDFINKFFNHFVGLTIHLRNTYD